VRIRFRCKRTHEPALPVTREEIQEALQAMRQAEDRLNMAEGDFVEVAVLELTAAQKRLEGLVRLAKAGHSARL